MKKLAKTLNKILTSHLSKWCKNIFTTNEKTNKHIIETRNKQQRLLKLKTWNSKYSNYLNFWLKQKTHY